MYSFKRFPQYDMLISNYGDNVLIYLQHPELIKELFAKDVSGEYQKQKKIVRGISRVIHDAITLSEGKQWKKKRKYATIFLNYEYIYNQIPVISQIIDRRLDQFAKGKQKFAINILELTESITSTTVVELFFGGTKNSV